MKRIRLKHVAKIIMGQSPPSDEVNEIGLGRPFLQGNSDFGSSHPIARTYCDSSPKKATAGDLLLSVRAPVGAMNSADHEYGIGRGLCAVRAIASRMNQRFANYSIIANLDSLKSVAVGSTYDAVTTSDVGMLTIHIGDLDFQASVSDFLDRETTEADALVAKYERLIELLEEKRATLITQAVTKGLRANGETKESGIEWLGRIPSTWNLAPLKWKCSLIKDGTHLPPSRVDEGVPLLSVRNLQNGQFGKRDDDSLISENSYKDLCRSFIPRPGDVALAIVGATLGKSAIIPKDIGRFQVQRSIAIFRTEDTLDPGWLNYVFMSSKFQELLWQNVGFSAQPGIYLGTLSNIVIAFPEINEQVRILDALQSEMKKIEQSSLKAQQAVGLLKERRSALITAAVTGQIDVRTYHSKQLPMEVAE